MYQRKQIADVRNSLQVHCYHDSPDSSAFIRVRFGSGGVLSRLENGSRYMKMDVENREDVTLTQPKKVLSLESNHNGKSN